MLATLGCVEPDPDPEPTCFDEPPTLTIGTGDYEWQDLSAGDELTMVHGPQGGWHMLGSVRVTGMDPVLEVHYAIERGAELLSDNEYRVQALPEGECGGMYPGMYGYLDVDDIEAVRALAGEAVTLRMEVQDASGRTATASVDVIAALDPRDEPAE